MNECILLGRKEGREEEEEEEEEEEAKAAGPRGFDFMVSGLTHNMVRYFGGLLARG